MRRGSSGFDDRKVEPTNGMCNYILTIPLFFCFTREQSITVKCKKVFFLFYIYCVKKNPVTLGFHRYSFVNFVRTMEKKHVLD